VQADLLRELNRAGVAIDACRIAPAQLAELVGLIDGGAISGKIGKDVFGKMFATGDSPAAIVEREGLAQVSDRGELEAICARLVAANPKQAEGYRGGNSKLLGYFVGQVMKETGGKANPGLVNEVLKALLEKP
jgi:aspartyl-tRNA(Asn)/glutamyl-tRNA(Gln) amidotransferase subunit B